MLQQMLRAFIVAPKKLC